MDKRKNTVKMFIVRHTTLQAFTLVDLLGSIAIISLLALLALPSIKGALDAANATIQSQKIQVLNFALEQARIRKDNPILYSGTKYEVYDYLVENNFLIDVNN